MITPKFRVHYLWWIGINSHKIVQTSVTTLDFPKSQGNVLQNTILLVKMASYTQNVLFWGEIPRLQILANF